MGTYAAGTDVSSDRSIAEIRKTVTRYGATEFAYAEQTGRALVAFVAHGRQVRFVLPMPDRAAREFTLTPTGRTRSVSAAAEAFEQAMRQRWRALALVVKAKLEAVEAGISQFEQEFYGYVVLPGGQTVYEATAHQVSNAIETGEIRPLIAIEGN